MRRIIVALIVAASLAGPASAASWSYSHLIPEAQGGGGQGKGGSGRDRGDGRREGPPQQQDRRAERDDRRDRMSDDDRRALHRDLDKANRELYRRRDR